MNDSIEALRTIRRHLRFGWWAVGVFLLLGASLELMHAFKLGFYLDVSNSTRRHMWTLAHAHGALLGFLNLLFAFSLSHVPDPARRRELASSALLAGSVLVPGGFFLGGLVTHQGDPGLGVLLVPVGAVLLFATVFWTALSLSRS